MKWLVAAFPECRIMSGVEEAAKHGELRVLEWLWERSRQHGLRVFWGARELFFAGQHGHLEVAQWLHEHTAPPPTHMFFVTLEEAARSGDMRMVRWLCEVRGEWSPYAAVLAASRGHLEVLKWLRTNLFSSNSSSISMDDAAAGGHLEVLRWLQNHSGYATLGAMNKAAANGHIEVVQWLHEHRREGCTTDAVDLAASHGERSEGCSAKAFINATAAGELEVLQWLFEYHRERLGRDRLRLYALGKFYILHWLKVEAGVVEREAFMGEENADPRLPVG
ncbi:hypothetical protein BBJ28_00025932 [Nothophytophthora sp. Chile5]|nr:hypothetical protein BBJ28_00025932 [Nothophytophthora sp. Chile5]